MTHRDTEAHERRLTLDGVPIRYLEAGAGPPVLLLHGAGEGAGDWLPVLHALGRDHRALAPDFPGFGGSGRPPGRPYEPACLGRFAARFLAGLGIRRAAVVGHSLGGLAALHLALAGPDHVRALVLVGSVGLGRAIHPGLAWLSAPLLGDSAAALAATPLGSFQRPFVRSTLLFARPDRVPIGWIADQHDLAARPDFPANVLEVLRCAVGPNGQREVLLDRLAELPMPTLVVWGAADQVVPIAHARAAVARLRRGALAILPDAGHLPHVEQPNAFTAALAAFLDAAGRAAVA